MKTLKQHTRRPAGDPEQDFRLDVRRSDTARAASRRRLEKRKQLVEETINDLKKGPCMDCGNTFHPVAMQFDHVKGEKLFSVANFKRQPTRSLQTLFDEIAKCDLVCACCHAVRTFERGRAG